MPKKFSRKQTISFKEKVFQVVKRIPKGKVLSYKIVAKLAGFPRAWRVVGNILNKNKNYKIPCHRVIRSDGKIGGYKHGTKKKISLLKKEGVIIRNCKIASEGDIIKIESFKRRRNGDKGTMEKVQGLRDNY